MTEPKLIAQVAAGNAGAMRRIFELHHAAIYGYLLRQTRDAHLSADLSQTVFYRAMKYSASYNPEFAVRTWLFQIARNVWRSYLAERDKLLTDAHSDVPEPGVDWPPNEPDYEQLSRALLALTEQERELIELHRYQGLSYAEIAQVLGSSADAVKMRAHRAMKRLKDLFFSLED